MRPAAKAIEARFRAAVGVLEPPAAREMKLGCAALDKTNDAFRVAAAIVTYPENGAVFGSNREQKSLAQTRVECVFFGQGLLKRHCAGGVLGRADIEQA